MIALLLLFNILYGFLSHLTHPYIKAKFSNGWYDLVKHATGALMLIPVFALLEWMWVHDAKKVRELIIKYCFVFGTFGLGNFLSWLFIGG